MSLYGHLIRRVVFPLYEKGLRGRPTVRYFRDYQENEFLSESNLLDLQARKLGALLRHCYQQVPYYQQVFNQRGITPADIPTIDELSILPILDKKSIRQNYQSLISKESSPSPVRKATGGSTGVPLTFEHDRDSYYRRVAVMWRGYGWAGARLGDPTIYLWGAPTGEMSAFGRAKEAMYHALNGRRMLNAFELSDSNVDQYIDEIQRYKPKTIVAYVAPLVEVARYCRAKKVTPFSPDSIITGAEPLPEASREFLQQVFRCPVFNTYGSREFMLIAAECERHAGLHINIDQVVVEIVDDHGLPTDGPGRILVTDLHNTRMPFVRYEIGDIGMIEKESCPCGRPFPLLKYVEGRILDVLRTPEGRPVPGEFFPHLLKDFEEIRNFQVVQSRSDQLTLKLVWGGREDLSAVELVRQEVAKVFGPEMELRVEILDRIDRGPSGKHRVTVNQLSSQ